MVDAQLTRSDARKVVAMIERTRIERLTVFITHAHPDHYLGLAEILAAFPRARVFSNATTATAIAQHGADARDYWKQTLGDDIADRVVVPEVVRSHRLELEEEVVRVIDFFDSESVMPSVVYVKARGWLFSGDLVYSGVHLQLAEDRARNWRRALDELAELDPINEIFPGHGEVGSAGLIERNRTYLTHFIKQARKSADAVELFESMNDLYPAYRLPFFLRHAAENVKGGPSR